MGYTARFNYSQMADSADRERRAILERLKLRKQQEMPQNLQQRTVWKRQTEMLEEMYWEQVGKRNELLKRAERRLP